MAHNTAELILPNAQPSHHVVFYETSHTRTSHAGPQKAAHSAGSTCIQTPHRISRSPTSASADLHSHTVQLHHNIRYKAELYDSCCVWVPPSSAVQGLSLQREIHDCQAPGSASSSKAGSQQSCKQTYRLSNSESSSLTSLSSSA